MEAVVNQGAHCLISRLYNEDKHNSFIVHVLPLAPPILGRGLCPDNWENNVGFPDSVRTFEETLFLATFKEVTST